jgi:hypothetical protein
MSDDKWGIGDPTKAQPHGHTTLGKHPVELLWGEHPHSRSDNCVYARTESGTIYEFDGHRVLLEITFKQYNYLKESELSGDQIRKGGTCAIFADGEQIYEFFFRDMDHALLRANHILGKLSEHSSFVLMKESRDKLIGRKIWYDRTPAVIQSLILDQGCIIIAPEQGYEFQKPVWADDDYERDGPTIKDDILSNHIWWYRN